MLDLAVTWPGYVSLITLSEQHTTAATVDQRAIFVAAAGYPSAVLSSPLQSTDSILTLSIGILVTSLVILRSAFGRAPGILGVTTGLVGIASVAQTELTGEVVLSRSQRPCSRSRGSSSSAAACCELGLPWTRRISKNPRSVPAWARLGPLSGGGAQGYFDIEFVPAERPFLAANDTLPMAPPDGLGDPPHSAIALD